MAITKLRTAICALVCFTAFPALAGFVDYTDGRIDQSSGIALRTAHYYYNQDLNQLNFQGRDCQVLNLHLLVTSGYVQIQYGEEDNFDSNVTTGSYTTYKDYIYAGAGMFVYSLYEDVPANKWSWKKFKLVGNGTGTAFGYCYSQEGYLPYVALRSGTSNENRSCESFCSGF